MSHPFRPDNPAMGKNRARALLTRRIAFVCTLLTFLIAIFAAACSLSGMEPFAQGTFPSGAAAPWVIIACTSFVALLLVSRQDVRGDDFRPLQRDTTPLGAMSRMVQAGGWELDPATGKLYWTDEIFRIYGLDPGEEPTLEDSLAAYDPDDRETLKDAIQRAIEHGEAYDLTLGLTTVQGKHRLVRSVCVPECHKGRVARLHGAFQDVTEKLLRDREIHESEVTYRLLAENVRDIIWTVNLNLEFTYVSPSVQRIRGYTPEEAIKSGPASVGPPGTWKTVREAAMALLAAAENSTAESESTRTMELDLYRKDGSTFPAEIVVTVLRDAQGRPNGLLGATRDITERKRVEHALRESEAALKTTGRIAHVGGWELDPETRAVTWSEETFRIFEREPDYKPPPAQVSIEFYDPADRDTLWDAVDRAIRDGEPFDLELRATTHTGNKLWLRNICDPLVVNGHVVKLRGTIQDITERKHAEAHLRLLESVITHTNDAVMITEAEPIDEPGPRILFVNEAFTTLTGYTAEEAIGRSPRFLQGPETDPAELGRLREAMRAFESAKLEVINYKKDGEQFWNEFHVSPVSDERGRWTHFIALQRDTTERKKAEAERLELGARAAAVIENAVDGIVTFDETGAIESANPAAERLFAYTLAELKNRNIQDLISGPHQDENANPMRHAGSGELNIAGGAREVTGRKKGGENFPMKLSTGTLTMGGKRLYTGIIHDLTHEAELERQLLRSQKLESLGTLAGGIAHDFNNILQAVLGYSNIARAHAASLQDELLEQCLSEIEKGSIRASSLVNQILTFSRKSNVDYQPIDLATVLRDAVQFLRGSIPSSVRIEPILPDGPCMAMADTTQIHQLSTNLGVNALHAMEETGGVLTVSLERVHIDMESPVESQSRTLAPGAYARLSFADTGCGIPPEYMDRILDPFFTTKDKGRGTGLGLATVHGIVTRMGGRIEIESEAGRGTRVHVLIPLLPDDFELPAGADPGIPHAASAPGTGAGLGVAASVLVVDDEKSIVTLLSQALRSHGFEVAGFTNPLAALEAARANPTAYTVAICDYTMPEMSGIALANALHELNPDLPIFLATGMLEQEALDVSKNMGIVEIFTKPFRVQHLIAAFQRVTSGADVDQP